MLTCLIVLLIAGSHLRAEVPKANEDASRWFEQFKQVATDEELYRFLYAMPKGGDLHNHSAGAVLDDWIYQLAIDQSRRGYTYYTRVRVNNCRPYGVDSFGKDPYLIMFVTLEKKNYEGLDECEKSEYKALSELDEKEKNAWLEGMVLDKPYEGRDEFFERHWTRRGDLHNNPFYAADALVLNMQAYGREGMRYLETIIAVFGFNRPDGSLFTADEVAEIYRNRLKSPDALATKVKVRLQLGLVRFRPNAEDTLRKQYAFVARNRDLWVAVNFGGREDNDKGYPLRFLQTLRELRHEYHSVRLSIHSGEVDEPNYHVRDTLLLGADRIGHGVNLITDADTMRLMRHGPYLVEINLISNLLLEYVPDYSQHPFPEYLRTGIPVALSTDDRGMWDSNLTDEFFVAVTEFNLSWAEIISLSRNSLQYSFAEESLKERLLHDFSMRVSDFERRLRRQPQSVLSEQAMSHGFICRRYNLCELGLSAKHGSDQP
jgi:adenosine deaminase CECR1